MGVAATGPQLSRSQRGTTVRGSIVVARAGSRVRVDVLAPNSAVGGKGSKPVAVGSYAKSATAGKLTFAVPLNAKAKKALRKRKLTLSVRITVTPASGPPYTTTSSVKVTR
jgi:hypothetical protein